MIKALKTLVMDSVLFILQNLFQIPPHGCPADAEPLSGFCLVSVTILKG